MRINDRAPGENEAHLCNRLKRQGGRDPLPANLLQVAQRLVQTWNQPQHEEHGNHVADQLEAAF